MNAVLGRADELPQDYYEGLRQRHLMPLWPSLRAALPHGKPARRTQPALWRYADVRPELMRAGELAPIEKAERRVLVLCNPGMSLEELKATPSIYIGTDRKFNRMRPSMARVLGLETRSAKEG